MLDFAQYCLAAATILVALGALTYVAAVALRRGGDRTAVTVAVPAVVGGSSMRGDETSAAGPARGSAAAAGKTERGLSWYGSRLVQLALVALTGTLVARSIATGHAPFSNQYEFAVSFAWGLLAAQVYFEWRYRVRALALLVLPITLAMLLYASTTDATAAPLLPALQNHLLLTLHVVTAVLAYGAAGVAFGAGVLYLLAPRLPLRGLPSQELLDEIGYRGVVFAFPLLTIMIILGAIWADIAWGHYWSWDPKETAALVTWLIYGAYLHARVVRDWRGTRAAWLLIVGFLAILFTYFGNLFFGGLHAYA